MLLISGTACPASGPGPTEPRHSATPGMRQMVATAHPRGTAAALDVLRRGGTAFDAAVVAAFVVAVTEPYSSGLGGGGFAVLWDAKRRRARTLDFRERAPLAATETMYQAPGLEGTRPSQTGGLAVATPGMVAGMHTLARSYGAWSWRRLLEPARRAAMEGFRVYPLLREAVRRNRARLDRFPGSRRIFLPGGRIPESGSILRQRDLGDTLARLQRLGARGFYEGPVAQKLVTSVKGHGGILTLADLKRYRARFVAPVRGRYRGHELVSMGSPSSGGAHIIQILQILEGFPLPRMKPREARRLHLVAEAMRLAFADRARYQGDASFVKVPVRGLIAPAYAAALRRRIHPDRAAPSGTVKAGRPGDHGGGKHTTHVCVVDRWGNAVSMTLTINTWFGSGITAAGTGVVLNNEMDDFVAWPGRPNYFGLIQGRANAVQGGKAPLSSMAPTLVFRGGRLQGLLGAAGGPMIITSVVQLLLGAIDHGLDPTQAMGVPRIHHQWRPSALFAEPPLLGTPAAAALRRMGHTLRRRKAMANAMLLWRAPGGGWQGAADPRRVGRAAGF